jgi:hypothetical protein
MSSIVGREVRLPNNCKCGSDFAVVGASDGKFYATLTCSCVRKLAAGTEAAP